MNLLIIFKTDFECLFFAFIYDYLHSKGFRTEIKSMFHLVYDDQLINATFQCELDVIMLFHLFSKWRLDMITKNRLENKPYLSNNVFMILI